MLGEEYKPSFSRSAPGSRRVTPSKTLPTEIRTPNSNKERIFGGSVPRVSIHTVHRLLTTEIKCNYIIVDCRYPYEFEGGHIATAVSCPPNEKLTLMDWLFNPEHGVTVKSPTVLVMHCEFSQCRAPRMATDVLREYLTRGLNTGLEVYIMKGGYCEFFRNYRQWCDPMEYIAMHDKVRSRPAGTVEFDAEMFLEKKTVSCKKQRRRFRISGSIGGVSAPSDSPYFHAACSPMDYSPVRADLASVFVEVDDLSNSSTAASRRNVYIHTEEEADDEEWIEDEGELNDQEVGLEMPPGESGLPSVSPSRSSSCSSIFPVAKRRASAFAVLESRNTN